jgi:hypothetical protein
VKKKTLFTQVNSTVLKTWNVEFTLVHVADVAYAMTC